MSEKSKILALKRLVLAHITFQQVIASCDFLIAHDSDEHSQFYGPFFSGICVSYMRPFMSAEGLGPLPKSYEEFPSDTAYAKTHADLKNGRNWAYAHNSPQQAAGLLQNEKEKEEHQRIRFSFNQNGITFSPPEVTWSKSRLGAIAQLATFQIQRIMEDVHPLMKNLASGKSYDHGIYILGETFPKNDL
jgi:hypothetical protein